MSAVDVTVRFMSALDLDRVVRCESLAHMVEDDPDFHVPQPAEYAWHLEDFKAAVKQSAGQKEGHGSARTVVATTDQLGTNEWGQENCLIPVVMGSLVYDIKEDGYHVRLLSVHPEAPKEVRLALFGRLMRKATEREGRKRITADVPDGDYKTLAFYQAQGWTLTLVPNRTGNDSWLCEHVIEANKKGGNKKVAK